MAVYLKDFFCRQGPFQYLRILYIEIRPIVCFVVIQRMFSS